MATAYRRSNQVLDQRNSYHGLSFSTIAITGNRSWSPTSLSGLSVSFVHGGYRLRSPFRDLDDDAYTAACVQDLRDVIDMTTGGAVACMIAEPIQGVGGFATPPDGLFGAMKRDVLDPLGILFISDEVQTGWGRTGEHFWGYEAHDLVPDLLTFAKGVANGLPLAGVVARAEVANSIGTNSISTFGGNPISVAAASANLQYLLDHDLQANAFKIGTFLRERLDAAAARHRFVGEVRGRGLMLAIETVVPGTVDPAPASASAVHEALRARGVLVGKGGLYGNVLRIAPPLSLSADEAALAADAIVSALDEVGAAH
jgi:4-aminobutyrate aminotransferase